MVYLIIINILYYLPGSLRKPGCQGGTGPQRQIQVYSWELTLPLMLQRGLIADVLQRADSCEKPQNLRNFKSCGLFL